MTPRIIKNWTASINGRGMAGLVDEAELPEIEVKTEEHRGGGMDGTIEVDMGLAPLKVKLKISDPDAPLLRLVGNPISSSARIIMRASYVRDADGARVAVVAEMAGRLTKGSFGTWKAGTKSTQDVEGTLNYYRLTIGGEEVYEIDVENMVRRIGGVDVLADMRRDLNL